MTENKDSLRTELQWPEWLMTAAPEMTSSLSIIADICETIRQLVKEGHISEQVMQSQFNAVSDQMIKNKVISPDGKILDKNITLSKEFTALVIYNNMGAFQILKLFVYSKEMTLVHLIDATISAICAGNLLVSFICLRSVLENISIFDFAIDELRPYSIPESTAAANERLGEIRGKLINVTYSTRVDWEGMLMGDSAQLIEKNKIKYKSNELRHDRTSKTILDSIDHLNKKVKGTRAVYEILCEFAHPNVGLVLGLTQSISTIQDKHGFNWVRRKISLDPPISTIKDMSKVINQIMSITAKCVKHFQILLTDADEQIYKVQKIIQMLLHPVLSKNKDILDPYSICPCGSGKKIKFCCGATNQTTQH